MENLDIAIIIGNSEESESAREAMLREAELLVLSLPESANLALIPFFKPNRPWPSCNGFTRPLVPLGSGPKNRTEMLNQIASLDFDGPRYTPLAEALEEAQAVFKASKNNSIKEVIYIGPTFANFCYPVTRHDCSPLLPVEKLKEDQITVNALIVGSASDGTPQLVRETKGMWRYLTDHNVVKAAARMTAEIKLHAEKTSVKGKILDRTEK